MHNNAQILAAVLNRFAQPIAAMLSTSKLSSMPFIQGLENKIRSTGWVSGNWSISAEVAPFIEPVTGAMLQPMLTNYLSQLPNESIPAMAHGIVDKAIKQGELSLFEGQFVFEMSDLQELKRLLNANMPITTPEDSYIVKDKADETQL